MFKTEESRIYMSRIAPEDGCEDLLFTFDSMEEFFLFLGGCIENRKIFDVFYNQFFMGSVVTCDISYDDYHGLCSTKQYIPRTVVFYMKHPNGSISYIDARNYEKEAKHALLSNKKSSYAAAFFNPLHWYNFSSPAYTKRIRKTKKKHASSYPVRHHTYSGKFHAKIANRVRNSVYHDEEYGTFSKPRDRAFNNVRWRDEDLKCNRRSTGWKEDSRHYSHQWERKAARDYCKTKKAKTSLFLTLRRKTARHSRKNNIGLKIPLKTCFRPKPEKSGFFHEICLQNLKIHCILFE